MCIHILVETTDIFRFASKKGQTLLNSIVMQYIAPLSIIHCLHRVEQACCLKFVETDETTAHPRRIQRLNEQWTVYRHSHSFVRCLTLLKNNAKAPNENLTRCYLIYLLYTVWKYPNFSCLPLESSSLFPIYDIKFRVRAFLGRTRKTWAFKYDTQVGVTKCSIIVSPSTCNSQNFAIASKKLNFTLVVA